MASIKDWMKDKLGNIFIPKTLTSAVYDDNGVPLSEFSERMLVTSQEETVEINNNLISNVTSRELGTTVSDLYDSSKTYAVGNYCIKDDQLYKCNTDITEAEEFDASKWTATTCADEFDSLSNKLTNLANHFPHEFHFYLMGSVDDFRQNWSIGMNIFNFDGYSQAYIMFNLAWIHLEISIGANNTIAKRSKYGDNGWSDWSFL